MPNQSTQTQEINPNEVNVVENTESNAVDDILEAENSITGSLRLGTRVRIGFQQKLDPGYSSDKFNSLVATVSPALPPPNSPGSHIPSLAFGSFVILALFLISQLFNKKD